MRRDFKIFSICVVKNEADVIGSCLREAMTWSDRIFVFDNGSTDGTWELVNAMAGDIVVPWRQDNRAYRDTIRADVFNQFRHEAAAGDWWCKLDADEFYITDPHAFLNRVPRRQHVVWGLAANFYLTQPDIENIDFNKGFDEVRARIRHFRADSSEARFFRHRDRLRWPSEGASWPIHMGVVHPEMIPFRHYQFRSPDQMQRRLETRRAAVERGYGEYWARQSFDWKDHLVSSDTCQQATDDGHLEFDHRAIPTQHLEPPFRRLVKAVLHGTSIWP